MTFSTVSVAGNLYVLPQDADVEDLRSRLVSAVRDGGGIVPIPSIRHHAVHILVSVGVPVIFEEHLEEPEPNDSPAGDDAWYRSVFDDHEWDGLDRFE
ncbi:hypothetical protein ACFDTO_04490 [Microbacteriaceae bacterium 4G12]